MEVVHDDTAHPEVIWTFYSAVPNLTDNLSDRLAPGIDRGRITLYSGIDCNTFFPRLYGAWVHLEPNSYLPVQTRSNPVNVSETLAQEVMAKPASAVVIEGDDEDRPPLIEIYVGRDTEMRTITDSHSRAVFVTGIGGQGKSTLAAKYFSDCQTSSTFSYFVWRDCKEESERFEIQLASVIEGLSEGRLTGKDLAQQKAESIVDILIAQIENMGVLFVFDNVDHYVDIDARRLIGSAHAFVDALIGSRTKSRAIFTCRPSIGYDFPDALSVPLEGITLEAAERLFVKRKAISTRTEIEDAHRLTEGHTFWLDLLAIQVAQRTPTRDLRGLLSDIRAGGGPLPANTLNSIWSTLRERERAVLRTMAETVKPETEVEIADYLDGRFTFNKVFKALRELRSLNLIVIKRRAKGPDLLELHPLVRQFIRQSFPKNERASYIERIILVYKRFMGQSRSGLKQRPALSLLQYWTQNAELDIAVGNIDDAFFSLHEVADAFATSGYPRELTRAVRLLLSSTDWVSEHARFTSFESVFQHQIYILSYLGETKEVDALLAQYEVTVPNRDARFINYCHMRCQAHWLRGDFEAALEWGKVGQSLIEQSDLDSQFTDRLMHTMALVERDAGRPESALAFFLDSRSLAEVIDPEELDQQRGEAHYGNIGRCLHFMGQIEAALVCYQKSALLIERNPVTEHVVNQGYIRTWIGELLSGREEFKLAYVFLYAAEIRWKQVAPPKAKAVSLLLTQIEMRLGYAMKIKDEEADKLCLDWMLGRTVDIRPNDFRSQDKNALPENTSG